MLTPRSEQLAPALLAPHAVAIVGQSDDAGKTAGRPLKFLRQAGFAGRVYPINAHRDTVLGERAWASLAALPEVPDHVYIVTGADGAVSAAAECGRLGVKVATILADGFTEAGPEGLARGQALRTIVAETGLRIVGPSSLGVVNLHNKLLLTANAAFDEQPLPAGRIFAASHSGSMIGALLSRGLARGVGFAGLVSVGGEVDLSLGEICAATLDDPGIEGYMLFLETLRHAEALRAFACAASRRGKPILAYKLGRSAEARELAVSHTGALAGEDDVADAFLKDWGIARVDTLDGLIEGLPLMQRVPAARGRSARVGVVTTTAGGATMVVDPLAARGVAIAPPSEATLARLNAAGLGVKPARLIDLTLTGTRYESMKAALDIVAAADEFDLVLVVVGSSARFYPELAVKPIIDSSGTAHAPAKPIAAFLVPDAPAALAALAHAGIPSFRTPEACADVIAAALSRRAPRELATPACIHQVVTTNWLDELAAYQLIDRLGIPRTPTLALDLPLGKASLPFTYPVAVKALVSGLAHKTDVGGVVLNVGDEQALRAAIGQISTRVATLSRVLVQPMIKGLGEALIGYRVDPDVGPLVLVAAGGIFTELYRDRSLRLAPVDLATAEEMIAEVRGLGSLRGYRGKPAGDLTALARATVALSQLALDPNVLEAELNPLIVQGEGEGVVAVDASVKAMV